MIVLRPRGPNVQVFPFQQRIDRPADLKSKRVRLRPEKQDELRRRSATADFPGKFMILVSGRACRLGEGRVQRRAERRSAQQDGESGGQGTWPVDAAIATLRSTAQQKGSSCVRRQEVVRTLEMRAGEDGDAGQEPGRAKAHFRVGAPPAPPDRQPGGHGQEQAPR